MKIHKLEVFGYGKWVEQTFELQPDFQVFAGPNEAGKSSIMQFITGVLFGFPKREGGHYAFAPLKGNRSGGRVYLTDETYGELIVERALEKDKMVLSCMKPSGEKVDIDVLQQVLYNVTFDRYNAVYAFDLADLQKFGMIEKEQLNRHLLSIGVSGSEQLLTVADQFQKQADQIYTPRSQTRQLDKKIKELLPIVDELAQSQENDQIYRQALLERQQQAQKVAEILSQIETVTQQQQNMQTAVEQYPAYQKLLTVRKQLSDVDYSAMPADGAFRFEQALNDQERLTEALDILNKQYAQVKATCQNAPSYAWYTEKLPVIQQVLGQQDEIYQLDQQLQHLNQAIDQTSTEKEHEHHQYGRLDEKSIPAPLDEETKAQLSTWLKQQETLKADAEQIQFELSSSSQSIQELTQQLEKLHEEQNAYESREQLQQQLREVQRAEQEASKGNTWSAEIGIILVVGVILSVLGILFPDYKLGAWIGAAICLGRILFTTIVSSSKKTAWSKGTVQADREQVQSRIRQLDQIIAKQDVYQVQLQKAQQQQNEGLQRYHTTVAKADKLAHQLDQWLQHSPYQMVRGVTVKEIVEHDLFAKYRHLAEKLKQLEEQREQVRAQVATIESTIAFLWEPLAKEKPATLWQQFEVLKNTHHDIVTAQQEQRHQKTQLAKLSDERTKIEQQLQESEQIQKELLQLAHVTTYEEFECYWQEKTIQEQLRQQAQTLAETLGTVRKEMTIYSDQQALEEALQAIVQEQQALKEQHMSLINQQAKTNQLIQNLEKDGTYISRKQQFEQKATDTRALMIQWAAQQLASKVLTQTLLDGKEHYLTAILNDATNYFTQLTQDRYQAIQFSKKQLTVVRHDLKTLRLNQLSRGTLDQLYIALRLAFIKNTAQIAPLPLMIDDGFVNFDAERTAIVLELLKDISQTTQVLYFTFAQNITDYVAPEQLTMLERND